MTPLDKLCIDAIRTLAMDAVERAKSGHPGAPMGQAPIAYALWMRHLRHDPADPTWPGRDRFVLSCGHASMLLYSVLYLAGYDLTLDDVIDFRQWESKTPGHPEFGATPGVETTTGPLGQGVGNAVGMALAAAHLGARFNRPGHDILTHRVYFLASDGDLMEGVSHESASLAGHLGLGNLIGIYDDNRITIDGPTALTFSEEIPCRFEAYGWHVQRVEDGNDLGALDRAMLAAQRETSRPSLIAVRTHIAYGSPNKQDSSASHGAPLGAEEVRLARHNLGWPTDEPFAVPPEALTEWRQCRARGAALQAEWREAFAAYQSAYPDLAAELTRRLQGDLPSGWEDAIPAFGAETGAIATRKASGQVLNAIAARVPELIGGSADLAGSNNTLVEGADDVGPGNPGGRNLHFGIREHAMGAILNGMALHGGFIPYGATFLVFSDYMRPPIRLAAMMGLRIVYVFTHDSIGVGEDGPTHQPVEMVAALRAIPKLTVIRPCDASETGEAWRVALRNTRGPTALILTRQKLPWLDRSLVAPASGLERGGYVIVEASGGAPAVVLMASGSEVSLILEAQRRLESDGIATRAVSMPSLELFAAQEASYRDAVLPPRIKHRVAVEAAVSMPWYRWVGDAGEIIAMDRFGASAPASILFETFGFTVDNLVNRVRRMVER